MQDLMPTTDGVTKRGGISAIGCPYVGREPI